MNPLMDAWSQEEESCPGSIRELLWRLDLLPEARAAAEEVRAPESRLAEMDQGRPGTRPH